jgi:hypothetical protein
MEIKNENNLIQEAFEVEAEEIGFCLDQKWGDYENPYENSDTFLAFNLFKKGWQAKSQAVPHILAARDVLAERDRQINQEHYSTEHDDEYTQNELLRAATCYSSHALARGWVHRSNLDPNTYQSEEAPDLWPWDLDFWKPKSPRHDLVRAAALLIAEIERIDRAQEQSHECK